MLVIKLYLVIKLFPCLSPKCRQSVPLLVTIVSPKSSSNRYLLRILLKSPRDLHTCLERFPIAIEATKLS